MTLEEIIEEIQYRNLNEECNHFIFSGLNCSELETILHQVSQKSLITNYKDVNFSLSYTKQIRMLSNIILDMQTIEVSNLLNVTLEQLQIEENIPFLDRKSLLRFRGILRKQEQAIQFIITNLHTMNVSEQKCFNELFAFNSYFINVTCLLKENTEFSTYQTLHGEMLDDREDYQKIHIVRY